MSSLIVRGALVICGLSALLFACRRNGSSGEQDQASNVVRQLVVATASEEQSAETADHQSSAYDETRHASNLTRGTASSYRCELRGRREVPKRGRLHH